MAEENKPQEGEQTQTPQEPTAIEVRAMEMGWRPKEEFDGQEDDFIDAKEFVRRQPLFDKIENTTKELKNVKRAMAALSEHYTKVQETEYNRALRELKSARKDAITNGDGDTFDQIDTEIKTVEANMAKVKQAVPQLEEPQVPQEFVDWTKRNSWYNTTGYMRAWADELGQRLHAQGKSPTEVLKQVEKEVQKEFPTKFRNPNKDQAPDMDSGSSKTAQSGKGKGFQLTDEQERVFKTIQRVTPGFTKEKYVADLKKINGVE
jgi:hypothetical protein